MAKNKGKSDNRPGAERFITSASGIVVIKKGGAGNKTQRAKNTKGGK